MPARGRWRGARSATTIKLRFFNDGIRSILTQVLMRLRMRLKTVSWLKSGSIPNMERRSGVGRQWDGRMGYWLPATNVRPCRALDHFTPAERSRSDERHSILHHHQSQKCAYVSASSEDRAGFHLHSSGWYHLGFGWLDRSSVHHNKMALVDGDVSLHAFAREALVLSAAQEPN